VMATHGLGGVRRAWLGSVADYLIRHLEVPVLLVRPQEGAPASDRPIGAGEILVPLDGSPLAEEVLDTAAVLARLWNSELSLLQVVHPVVLAEDMAFPFPTSYDEELTAMARTQAKDYLHDIVERVQSESIRASSATVVGWKVADSILEAARPERVALIALATHGRGGLSRLALGSVVDKLVRSAEVPVLVYHPSDRRNKEKRMSRGVISRGKRARRGQ
jgi:nucleotide-binding universal stress UspA family protein